MSENINSLTQFEDYDRDDYEEEEEESGEDYEDDDFYDDPDGWYEGTRS
jgi:hypothetical protein